MLADFRKFIAKGNVMDLAVAVIIGGAFALITASLVDDVIMPIVGVIFGGLDFSNYFTLLGPIPDTFEGNPDSYEDLKEAGVAVLGYGQFLTVVLNFVILGFIIFLLVRYAKKALEELDREEEEAAPAAKAPTEVELLQQIRDELQAQRGGVAVGDSTSHGPQG